MYPPDVVTLKSQCLLQLNGDNGELKPVTTEQFIYELYRSPSLPEERPVCNLSPKTQLNLPC